uniref:Uncharacterized protein n=1 Tax=Peronospora matthiolae TaxID=2874970 RepID=A0AAV1TTF6_9STRA
MDDEGEQQKHVASLSTVSLDLYSEASDGADEAMKPPVCNRCTCAPVVILTGLVLVAVGLVLVLDGDYTRQQVDHGTEDSVPTTFSPLTSSKTDLKAPAKMLLKWLEQMHYASALDVEGGSSDMNVNGVLFPQNSTDTLLPFNAIFSVSSGMAVPSQDYIAVANGRGYKWTVTSFGFGENLATEGCLSAEHGLPFDKLDSIVQTANWTFSDLDDTTKVDVRVDEETYTVYPESNNLSSYDHCWIIQRDDLEFGLRLCTSTTSGQLLQTEFEDLFNATAQCPELAPSATRTEARALFSVPLPLRQWYANYQTQ